MVSHLEGRGLLIMIEVNEAISHDGTVFLEKLGN